MKNTNKDAKGVLCEGSHSANYRGSSIHKNEIMAKFLKIVVWNANGLNQREQELKAYIGS